MPVQETGFSATTLNRIGRADPLRWPEWRYVGNSRFDDPRGRFRVLYAGERRACFIESLAGFRPGLNDPGRSGAIPAEWFSTRRIARFVLGDPSWRALDLRAPETLQTLRQHLRPLLIARGYQDLDTSHTLGQDQTLTQAITAWALDHGHRGIVYGSRLAVGLTCVAVFEGARFSDVLVSPIDVAEPDLRWAAGILGLTIPARVP